MVVELRNLLCGEIIDTIERWWKWIHEKAMEA
jgi:hypothetical protein